MIEEERGDAPGEDERPDVPGEETPAASADDPVEDPAAAEPAAAAGAEESAAEPDVTPAAAAEEPAAEPDVTPAAGAEEPAAEPDITTVAAAEGSGAPVDEPAAGEPAEPADEPAATEPAEPAATEAPSEPVADEPAAAEPDAPVPDSEAGPPADSEAAPTAAEEAGPPARERGGRGRERRAGADEPELIPGAHLEPDLVLEEPVVDRGALGDRVGAEIQAAEEALAAQADDEVETDVEAEGAEPPPEPLPTTVLDLAADARYRATGKRKSAVARVTLRPGSGVYTVNGRELDVFFPRPTLQRMARDPLHIVGQQERMDVVAKIHGGGVSSQAAALRHGIARALVEADPNLRSELKRRGFLTRDPRVKERKKAGLKKARKRPQFSKR